MVDFTIFCDDFIVAKLTLQYSEAAVTPNSLGLLDLSFSNNVPQVLLRQLLYYLTTTPFGKQNLDLNALSRFTEDKARISYAGIAFILNRLPSNWKFTELSTISFAQEIEEDLFELFGVMAY